MGAWDGKFNQITRKMCYHVFFPRILLSSAFKIKTFTSWSGRTENNKITVDNNNECLLGLDRGLLQDESEVSMQGSDTLFTPLGQK